MTEQDFKDLQDRVKILESTVKSSIIAQVGIEDLNEHQIEIVGDATARLQRLAEKYRFQRFNAKRKGELENKIYNLQQELAQYD